MLDFKDDLKISGSMTVKELEKIFDERLGLSVLVYRKSGNLWLEPTMTDNWTLEQQNENGRQISGEFALKQTLKLPGYSIYENHYQGQP